MYTTFASSAMDTLAFHDDKQLRDTLEEVEFQMALLLEFQKLKPNNQEIELRLRKLVWRASKCLSELYELRTQK